MTRPRFLLLASLAAAAVLGLLAWLVLGGGREDRGGKGEAATGERPAVEVPREEPTLPSSTPNRGEAPMAAGSAPGGGFDLPVEEPEGATLPGLASLEDGTPLAGVEFFYVNGNGMKTPILKTSLADGSFAVIPGLNASVHHPWAVPVAAAGGTLEGDVICGAPDADRLLLTFRDRPGTAHVRLVDASSGLPITDVTGLRMEWEFPGAVLTADVPADPGLGGWIPITEGRLPDNLGVDPAMLRADPAKVTVVLTMPGYAAARLPLPEVRGRREERVEPVEADVRGEVVFALYIDSRGIGDDTLAASLRSLDPDPQPVPERLLGLPRKEGPFGLHGLPDGSWELLLTQEISGGFGTFRARRAFEKRGAPVDLGKIQLEAEGGAALSVHVTDADGRPMPQASVVVLRAGESGDGASPLLPDDGGRVTVDGLAPGADYRVQVRGLPRVLEEPVRAEARKEGEEKYPPTLEFRWPEKLVPCRITLVVDGKVVANPDGSRTIPATIKESPLPRDRGAWGADGTFSAELVPGTYRFSAFATAKDGGGLVLFAGEVTVPAGEAFETRLEMRVP